MDDIHHINLAGLDLNLLVVFDALITEGSVTRAGDRVGLSQPATSNALARLRRMTGDPLFFRTAAGLRPTPKARGVCGPNALAPKPPRLACRPVVARSNFDG